ncbi:MAG: PqqD family protein [Chloroflexi bacterium]|nr:MAG: PqqD family protein [Chloroflexota bacterium]
MYQRFRRFRRFKTCEKSKICEICAIFDYHLTFLTVKKKENLVSQSILPIKNDLITDELEGYSTVLDADTGNYITLNQTGTAIWQRLVDGDCMAKIVQHLTTQYIVTPQQAQADLTTLLQELSEQPFIG